MTKVAPVPHNEPQRLAAVRRTNLHSTPRDPVFDRICQLASRLFETPIASITLIDEDRQWFKAKIGFDNDTMPRAMSFCPHAINQDTVMVVNDATLDDRFACNPLVTDDPHIRFYAGAALKTTDGYNLGTLCVLDTKPRHDFGAQDRDTLNALAEIAGARIKMRESAGYLDAATGIYTRQRMLEVLERELGRLRTDQGSVRRLVGIVDVAMPKQMQELTQVMGYQHTEQFIVECVHRLSEALGIDYDLYRIGLFRFGFLIPEPAQAQRQETLDRLVRTLREPFDSGVGILLAPSATLGVVPLSTDSTITAEEVLRQASIAADDAWESRRSWAFYQPNSDARRQRKFQLLRDLPAALAATDQLYLEYQPKIELATDDCTGVEALLRWQHPALGQVSPTELIEAAEKTALMRPLTDWVLDAALAQCAQWRANGLTLPVAVNVSAHDLSDPNLVARVTACLQRHGLSGNLLELEFTESALIHDLDAVIPKLRQLDGLGVSTAIDDFGTGYCNLSYVQKLNVGTIKIDRRFVQALGDDSRGQTLTRAIINLAQDLNYRIVAEGVETERTLEPLFEWGCEQAQGYLFSKPLRAARLLAWVRNNRITMQARQRSDATNGFLPRLSVAARLCADRT